MNERAENPGYGELMQENAALRQQLAEKESVANVACASNECYQRENDSLRQQLAEARGSEHRMIEVAADSVANAEFWKATTEVANQTIAAQAAELERLRKELDGAETYGAEMTRNWECVCKNNSGPFAQLLREVHERHFAELSTLQSESAAFEKFASDYQDVIARLDGDIDRLREAAEELVNMVGGNCSWQEVFTVIDGRLRAALTTKQEQGK